MRNNSPTIKQMESNLLLFPKKPFRIKSKQSLLPVSVHVVLIASTTSCTKQINTAEPRAHFLGRLALYVGWNFL